MRVNLRLLMPLLAQYTTPTWATLVAGFFVLLSLSLSIYLIFEHLSAYNNPEVCTSLSCAFSSILKIVLLTSIHSLFLGPCLPSAGTKVCSRCYLDGPMLCNWVGETSKAIFIGAYLFQWYVWWHCSPFGPVCFVDKSKYQCLLWHLAWWLWSICYVLLRKVYYCMFR